MEKDERANPVRAGEELPIVPLLQYLHNHLSSLRPLLDDERGGEIRVAQFGRGYSNLTYLLGVGEREFVLRRPPLGANIASAHDMGREVKVLRGLGRVYAYVPRVLLYCDESSVIGAPFYLMERLHGVVLRAEDYLAGDFLLNGPRRTPVAGEAMPPDEMTPEIPSPQVMAKLAGNVIENLATIHALDYEAAGLGDLGRPAGYVGRQVQGWTKRFYAAQSEPLPDLEAALRWLADHQPPEGEGRAALIHNDYKYDNLILDGDDLTRLVAVLDWEMCTLGDPLLDLGTTLGYWVEPNDPPALVEMFGLTTLPGNPNRAEVVERYVAASAGQRGNQWAGASFDPLFCYVYGLAKIGVILQQIYHRYEQGMSHDERFARLGGAVAACGLMASEAIRTRRISGLF
jgi:aminoglycoside phosphotransferase (APT) family kinase protein